MSRGIFYDKELSSHQKETNQEINSESNSEEQEVHEKRRQGRVKLKGYIADIAVDRFVCNGIIEDISVEGLRLNDLPARFAVESREYSLVVSGGPDSVCYKMTVLPRWKRRKNASYIDIGFQINHPSAGWKTFVQKIMGEQKKNEEDIWDQYNGSRVG